MPQEADQKPNVSNQKEPLAYTRLRGWGLLALYASLGILSLLLALAAYRIWPALDGDLAGVKVVVLVLSSVLTALLCMRATARMFAILRNLPTGAVYIDYLPFLAFIVTIFAAYWLFGGY